MSGSGVTPMGRSGALAAIHPCESGRPQTISGAGVIEGSAPASLRGTIGERSWEAR